MKKLLAIVLVLVLSCCAFASLAEETEQTNEAESGSKFESVMLKKGTLIVKEFLDCCTFEEDEYFTNYARISELFGFTDTLKFQTASILDVETGVKLYALRISTGYYSSQYSYGEAVGVMDADEIDGAIQTLKYIQQNINSLKDYSEVVYKASSGMEVGAYHSSTDSKIFVKVNSNATKFYTVDKIDSLIAAFEQVSATIGN